MQNLRNGKVKIVAEGEKTDQTRFLNCLTIRDALIDVKGDLKGRLVRMDADISQIKAKCGL